MSQTLRIVFMGTPEFAVGILDTLLQTNHEIVGIVTTPDKPSGRGQKVNMSDVKKYAQDLSIPILQPEKLKDEDFVQTLQALNADLFVVVAFRMLPEIIWAMPPKGTINLHASLLPQYRGAAPINWAIINGEKKTGVTTFFIEKEIDTGLVLRKKEIEITPDMTAGELHDALLEIGKVLVVESVDAIANNDFTAIPQSEMTTSPLLPAPKIFKQDCQIQWMNSAQSVHDFVRGLSPYPTAWTFFHFDTDRKDMSVKIFQTRISDQVLNGVTPGTVLIRKNELLIATSDYYLEILELQPEGKRRMLSKDFIQGYKDESILAK